MSKDPNAVDTGHRRRRGFIPGFVLGAALTAIVMGYLWSSDSALQQQEIRQLSDRISEKDATIQTLSSQLPAKREEEGPTTSGSRPPGGNP